jgi:glutaredoxin
MIQPVIVYSQPVCRYCDILKFQLINEDIDFEVRDVTEKEEYMKQLEDTGYQTTPVTVIGDRAFAGVATAEIKKILEG